MYAKALGKDPVHCGMVQRQLHSAEMRLTAQALTATSLGVSVWLHSAFLCLGYHYKVPWVGRPK